MIEYGIERRNSMKIMSINAGSSSLKFSLFNMDSNKVLLPFNVTKEQVEKLIKKSNIRGGTDNISIAYLKKESGDK